MVTIHHIGMRVHTEEQRDAFRTLGIRPQGHIHQLRNCGRRPTLGTNIAIAEAVQGVCVKAEYSDREMAAAEVLGLQATSQWGYPEPSGDFGYLSKTFDLAEYCNKCGIGGRQRAPFRLNTIPKLRGS